MESHESRELTRALDALNNNIGNLTRDLQGFSTSVIAQNPQAAGRAQASISPTTDQMTLVDQFGKAIKSVAEETKKEVATQKENNQELTKLLRQYRDVNDTIESELRLRKEALKLNDDQIKKEREKLAAQYANEQAETREKVKKLGYEIPQEGDKGVLGQLKDHFVKSDMSMKGLALSGGIMAISMALDAIKSLWGGIKEEVTNMNKNLRANQQTALSAQGGIGTGEFQTQQLKLAQNMVETDKFFIAAGVSAEQFSEAMIVNSRRLNESLSSAGQMRESIGEMTLHARAAGVAMREYQDTVVELTRTNQMDISQKSRAMDIADRIYATERALNLEKGYLLNNIKSTYQSLATMGYSIENVVGLNIRFADAIKAGRMSLNDIIDYAKGMKDATEGQRVFFGQMLQQYGSERGRKVESAVREMSGGDMVTYSYLMKKLIEGTLDKEKDAKLIAATGLTSENSAAFMRGEGDLSTFAMFKDQGGKGDQSGYEWKAWSARLRGIPGMATPEGTYAREGILDAAGKPLPPGAKAPDSEELKNLRDSTSKLTTMDEKLGVIKDTFINYVAQEMYGFSSMDMLPAAQQGSYQAIVEQYQKGIRGGANTKDLQEVLSNTLSQLNPEQLKKLGASAGGGNTFNFIGDPETMRRVLRDYVKSEAAENERQRKIKIDNLATAMEGAAIQ